MLYQVVDKLVCVSFNPSESFPGFNLLSNKEVCLFINLLQEFSEVASKLKLLKVGTSLLFYCHFIKKKTKGHLNLHTSKSSSLIPLAKMLMLVNMKFLRCALMKPCCCMCEVLCKDL